MNLATPIADPHHDCGFHFEPDHLDALASHIFQPSGVDGVYGRTGAYESVVEALAALISRHRPAGAEVFRFPPVMSRASLEKQGYLQSFPNLVGAVACLEGSERADHAAPPPRTNDGGSWTEDLKPADLVLAPAACYPVYPIAAAARRGAGRRAMSSTSPATASAMNRRAAWTASRPSACANMSASARRSRSRPSASPGSRAPRASPTRWACPTRVDVANDPFFGRVGTLMATPAAPGCAEIRIAGAGAVGGKAHRLHELQLSPGTFRRSLGPAQRQGRGAAHRLRRFRHGPAGGGAVRHPWRGPSRNWPDSVRDSAEALDRTRQAVLPASTVITVPVILRPPRPSGTPPCRRHPRHRPAASGRCAPRSCRAAPRVRLCVMSVSIKPGATALTVMSSRPTSRARLRVKPSIDALVAP